MTFVHSPEGHRALEVHGEHVAEVGLRGVDEVPDHQDLQQHHRV